MKSVVRIALLSAVAIVLCTSTSQAQYRQGGNWLGPVLTVATSPIGFGAQYEHGLTPNIGIGGIIRYFGRSDDYLGYGYSWSVVMPEFQAAYHFMPADQLDPYAGARLGWAIYSDDYDNPFFDRSSGLFLSAYGGLRYFFTPKIAGNGQLEILIGDDYFGSSLGLTIGVDFTI